MKASEARKLIGEKVRFRKLYSGITETGTTLSVQGRNVEVDIMGMRDWLWLPDVAITLAPTSDHH